MVFSITNNQNQEWEPVIGGTVAKEIADIVSDVATRCFTPELITLSEKQIDESSGLPLVRWVPSDTAGGASGLSILATYLRYCYPGEQWQSKSHLYLMQAVDAFAKQPQGLGLYSGATGIAFAVTYASENGTYYNDLLKLLDQYISRHLDAFLEQVLENNARHVTQYDVMSGAAGFAAYLMNRSEDADPELNQLYAKVLHYLVDVSKPDSKGRVCFITGKNIEYPARLAMFQHGYEDFGMAHGIAGIMAVLALAIINGWDKTWLRDALQNLCTWYMEQRFEDKYGTNWPAVIDPQAPKDHALSKQTRLSWCYGLPGKCRALYLAGKALNEPYLIDVAVSAIESIQARPRETWGLTSPNICHGISGMLMVLLRLYHDTKLPQLKPIIINLAEEIMGFYKEDSLFGFQDPKKKGIVFDNPRLLNGASGVALSLLAAIAPVPPKWDHFFLLS